MERATTSQRKNQKFKTPKSRSTKNKLLLIVLLLIVIFLAFTPVKNLVISKLIKYDTAQWELLEEKIPVQAVVIRDETLVTAPADGKYEAVVPEGEKVAHGRVIGYIQTQSSTTTVDEVKIPVKASRAGMISYHPDGLEGILKPDLLNNLDIDKISTLLQDKKETTPDFQKLEKGKPLCKIIDNLDNPFVYVQNFSGLSTIKKGEIMSVQFPNGFKKRIVIQDIKKSSTKSVLMAEILDAPDLSLKNRFISVDLIPRSYEGIVISKTSLVEKNNRPGVLIPREGIAKWVEVQVKDDVENRVIVSGLDVGSQYILNPSLVKEGQRIN